VNWRAAGLSLVFGLAASPCGAFAVTGNPIPEWQPTAAPQAAPRQILYSDLPSRPAEPKIIVPGSPFSDPLVRDLSRPLTTGETTRYLHTLGDQARFGY